MECFVIQRRAGRRSERKEANDRLVGPILQGYLHTLVPKQLGKTRPFGLESCLERKSIEGVHVSI